MWLPSAPSAQCSSEEKSLLKHRVHEMLPLPHSGLCPRSARPFWKYVSWSKPLQVPCLLHSCDQNSSLVMSSSGQDGHFAFISLRIGANLLASNTSPGQPSSFHWGQSPCTVSSCLVAPRWHFCNRST